MKIAVIGSFLLAILHSILFYGEKFGISIFLFCIALGFLIIYIMQKNDKIKNKKALILTIPILLISATYFIFNNSFFYVANIVALIILFTIMVVLLVFEKISISQTIWKFLFLILGPVEFLEEAVGSIVETISGVFKKKKVSEEKNEKIKKIVLGILIAIPILCVVLGLLTSADSIFGDQVKNVISTIFSADIFNSATYVNLFFRIIIIIVMSIYLIAIFYNILHGDFCVDDEVKKDKKPIDRTIGNTILTILNLVYIVFCYIQISVLFMKTGNMENFDYASYARQGFFQLMAVSLINLVIILITSRRGEESKKLNYTKIMNLCLAVFTLIILFSSFYRMYLYEQEYGYTFLRLMVYFVLITEVMLIIPTVMYILDMKINLPKTYFIIIIIMYIVVNYINIDNLIAKKNIDRYFEDTSGTYEIDIYYLQTLGVDAALQIKRLEDIDKLKVEDLEIRDDVSDYLSDVKEEVEDINFKNFNINRFIVKQELKNYYEE